MRKNMELVESESVLKKIFYRYIQEPFLKIKERWLAYFAGFAMDDEPSASDVETEIQSSEELPPKKERLRSVKPKVEDQSQLNLGRFAFISTAFGALFGLGHIWRFPNLAYKYGGGAFLIIYVVFTLLFGYALHFMEIAVGQYSSKSTLKIIDRVPLMQGVGYSIIAYGYVLSTYYSQVVSFGIYYFASSFDFDLPWTHCPAKESDSNETMCYMVKYPEKPFDMDLKCPQKVLVIDIQKLCKNTTYALAVRKECCPKDQNCKEFNRLTLCRRRQQPAAYHWTTNVIRHHAPNDPKKWYLDGANLKFLLCTFAAWLLIYVLVSGGIKWTGIITMALLPFLLTAFLLMIPVAVTIRGGVDGIINFFVPVLTDFYQSEIWYAALSHAFFSLGIAMGPGFTLGSLCKFRNPCHIDTFIVTFSVIITSVLSGTVVFSTIGYTSDLTGVAFTNGSTKGSGTSIIAYSDILSKFPVPWLSSAIFFFIFTFVIAVSVSSVVISISTSIGEISKVWRKDKYVINFLLVFSSFLFNVPMILREGIIIFSSLDNFTMRLVLPIICIFEILTFFVYGLHLLCEDISFMIGSYPNRFFRYSWMLCPFVIVAAFVYKFIDLEMVDWLHWTRVTELIVAALILCPVVLCMFGNIIKYSVTKKTGQILRSSTRPEPNSEELRAFRMDFKMRRTIF